LISGAQSLTGKILSHKELSLSFVALFVLDFCFHQNELISVERQGWMSQGGGYFLPGALWKKEGSKWARL
jgi:hypothetical protein